jgi:hypothetical protein
MKDKRPSLKDKYAQEEAQLRLCAEGLKDVESYEGNELTLKKGGTDSSAMRVQRMGYIKMAEREFLENNTKDIIKRAHELCLEDIGDETVPPV